MYSVFANLLDKNKKKVADVHNATGIPYSTFTDWKAGKMKDPKADKLSKIADYFGVSINYLITGEEDEVLDEDVRLLALIKNDSALSKAIRQLLSLPDDKRNHVYQLISYMDER